MDLPSKPKGDGEEAPQTLLNEYVEALIKADQRQADQLVQRTLLGGATAGDVYLDLFQKAAYEIGWRWQTNKVTVAQEHLATAIIERQMGDLHSSFKPTALKFKTVILGCVEHELHRIGSRMIADFFEQDGWNVIYLGQDVPTEAFISIAHDIQPDLIGVSAQMVIRLPALSNFINQLNRQGLGGIPVMAGGQPFIQQPDLFKNLNIHFSGTDARKALASANAWVGS
jgi:MerR family transcriptional regulator, light-induced transcriptional regulator